MGFDWQVETVMDIGVFLSGTVNWDVSQQFDMVTHLFKALLSFGCTMLKGFLLIPVILFVFKYSFNYGILLLVGGYGSEVGCVEIFGMATG